MAGTVTWAHLTWGDYCSCRRCCRLEYGIVLFRIGCGRLFNVLQTSDGLCTEKQHGTRTKWSFGSLCVRAWKSPAYLVALCSFTTGIKLKQTDIRKRSYRKGIVPRRHPTITRQNPDDCCECEILPFATRQQPTAQRTHTRGGLSPDNFGGQ